MGVQLTYLGLTNGEKIRIFHKNRIKSYTLTSIHVHVSSPSRDVYTLQISHTASLVGQD